MIAVWFGLFIAFASTSSSAVEVSTSLGSIRGVQLKSRLEEDFYAFRGIRYAKPPVGELRFKSPQPVSPWKPKIYDATDDGPFCPQPVISGNTSEYSEDCLILNVYSKDLKPKLLKPVVIYLHPGGFYAFSGQSKNNAGPQLLMDRDIVLVSLNYRLGTLGLLATGTADAPGNAAFKDQVLAFKWVQEHIREFGGDPNSVTLLGYSAGSVSIGLHLMSPMAKGLFHKAIAMSASPVSQVVYQTDQLDLAKKQAGLVNCPTNSMDSMMKCLKNTPVDQFVATFNDMFEFGYNPMSLWRAVVEKDFGEERFITEEPEAAYQAGRFHRIPLIIGMTKDEFMSVAYETLKNETVARQINDNWEALAPIMLQYEQNTPKSKEISAILRKEYLDNKPLTSTGPFEPFGRLYSDAIIGFGVHRFAHLAARYVPVHYYRFSYKGRFSYFNYPGETPYGSVHHDDLLYLLHIPYIAPLYIKTDPEDTTVERLTRMWTHFAKTGDPNNQSDPYLKNLIWKPLNLKDENFLDIGEELVNRNGFYLERFSIWKRLYPLNWSGHHCKKNSDSLDYPDPEETIKSK